MMFFFFFLCLTGDDSVNARGLDATAAVASTVVASVVVAVVASAVASVVVAVVVVVVALFWGGFFSPFTDYLGPPFFFVGMVPRLQI